jgi:hypothetical protein
MKSLVKIPSIALLLAVPAVMYSTDSTALPFIPSETPNIPGELMPPMRPGGAAEQRKTLVPESASEESQTPSSPQEEPTGTLGTY